MLQNLFKRKSRIDDAWKEKFVNMIAKALELQKIVAGDVSSEETTDPHLIALRQEVLLHFGKGAEWLVERMAESAPTLVGIDHGFSFPLRYFEVHRLKPDWPTFLDDFQRHWPTDDDHTYVDFVREGAFGNGAARMGNARWRRLTEERAGGAKSVFHFDVQGSVAKSTHAGIPWLRFMRQRLGGRVHFWPFDGWDILVGRSVVAEVYPALWSRGFARKDRTSDQHDAYCIAAWFSRADQNGSLAAFLKPDLTPPERAVAQVEGWILGVA